MTTYKYGRGVERGTIENKSIPIRRSPIVTQKLPVYALGNQGGGKEILSCVCPLLAPPPPPAFTFPFSKLRMKMLTPSFPLVHVIMHDLSRIFPRDIPSGGALELSIPTKACAGTVAEINKLEHVVLTISFIHRRRGDVSVLLMSPSGTKNEMLSTRHYDDSKEGLDNWGFMTVHTWGK